MKVNKNSSEDVDLAPIFTHKKAVIKREGEKRGKWRKREGRNGKGKWEEMAHGGRVEEKTNHLSGSCSSFPNPDHFY